MGKGRDKKKKNSTNSAKTKGKAESKAEKKAKKQSEFDEIDNILKEIQQKEAEMYAVTTETNTSPPSPRSNAQMFTSVKNADAIFMFGGEYFNGSIITLYNDLLKYSISRNEWSVTRSPNTPGPRSSHQIAVTTQNQAYLFGGEFVSKNETTFFHYKDFWRLDLDSMAWEKIEGGKRPTPRSGHRMVIPALIQVCWKGFLVLFGGFYDDGGLNVKYLDDLWMYDLSIGMWKKADLLDPKPTPRSGFQFIVQDEFIILYGGYTKVIEKGSKTAKGMVHADLWVLHMDAEKGPVKWERRKKSGFTPSLRSGCSMISWKTKGVMFGGVSDLIDTDENDMYQYNVDNNKWYPFTLRASKKKDDEVEDESLAFPWPRFNAQMCIVKNVLYLYGGILETKTREFTLKDFWSINLDKMQNWNCILRDDIDSSDWKGKDSDEDDDDSDDEDDSEDEEKIVQEQERIEKKKQIEERIEAAREKTESGTIAPLPSESLRDYFARTVGHWQIKMLNDIGDQQEFGTVKNLRRNAFEMAKSCWEEWQPKLEELKAFMEENEIDVSPSASNSTEDVSAGTSRSRR